MKRKFESRKSLLTNKTLKKVPSGFVPQEKLTSFLKELESHSHEKYADSFHYIHMDNMAAIRNVKAFQGRNPSVYQVREAAKEYNREKPPSLEVKMYASSIMGIPVLHFTALRKTKKVIMHKVDLVKYPEQLNEIISIEKAVQPMQSDLDAYIKNSDGNPDKEILHTVQNRIHEAEEKVQMILQTLEPVEEARKEIELENLKTIKSHKATEDGLALFRKAQETSF